MNWKEAGLGDNQNVTYNLKADTTGTWGCVNKGGNHPQASNKEDFSETLNATVTLTSGKNGNITGSLSVMFRLNHHTPTPATDIGVDERDLHQHLVLRLDQRDLPGGARLAERSSLGVS